jgi:hypothetical protein
LADGGSGAENMSLEHDYALIDLPAGVQRVCYVYLVCPTCHRNKWVRLQDSRLTRDELLEIFWAFTCPVHGLLFEKPLQAHEGYASQQVVRLESALRS